MLNSLIISIHNYKTAGVTFYSFIDRQFKRDEILNTSLLGQESAANKYLVKTPEYNKKQLKIVHGHFHFGIDKHFSQKTTYITFVRNPIERVISDYYYCRNNPLSHNYPFASTLSFKEYLKCEEIKNIDNGQTRFISGDINVPFGDQSMDMLDHAIKNLSERFSFIGITEKFDESVIVANRMFSWNKYYYKSKNVNPDKVNVPIEFDEETIELLNERNQLDIKLYEYALLHHEKAMRNIPLFKGWFFYLKISHALYNIVHPVYNKIKAIIK